MSVKIEQWGPGFDTPTNYASPSAAYKPVHGGWADSTRSPEFVGQESQPPVMQLESEIASAVACLDCEEIEEERKRDWEATAAKFDPNWIADALGLRNLSAAADEGRLMQSKPPRRALPEVYFDAVRIANVLRLNAHEASKRHWAIETAIRNVRLAETDEQFRSAIAKLICAVGKAERDGGASLSAQLDVEARIATVEG